MAEFTGLSGSALVFVCLSGDPRFIKEAFWPGQSVVHDDDKGVFLPNSLNRRLLHRWQRRLTSRRRRTVFSYRKLDKLSRSVDSHRTMAWSQKKKQIGSCAVWILYEPMFKTHLNAFKLAAVTITDAPAGDQHTSSTRTKADKLQQHKDSLFFFLTVFLCSCFFFHLQRQTEAVRRTGKCDQRVKASSSTTARCRTALQRARSPAGTLTPSQRRWAEKTGSWRTEPTTAPAPT